MAVRPKRTARPRRSAPPGQRRSFPSRQRHFAPSCHLPDAIVRTCRLAAGYRIGPPQTRRHFRMVRPYVGSHIEQLHRHRWPEPPGPYLRSKTRTTSVRRVRLYVAPIGQRPISRVSNLDVSANGSGICPSGPSGRHIGRPLRTGCSAVSSHGNTRWRAGQSRPAIASNAGRRSATMSS